MSVNTKYTLRFVATAAACCVLTGCILFRNDTRNVSNKAEFWGGTKTHDEYRLAADVFLCRSPGSVSHGLMPPGHPLYSSFPSSVDEFRNNPHAHSYPRIQDVVSTGTPLRVVKLVRWQTLKGNWGVATIAAITDGPFAKRKVNIDDLLETTDSTVSGVPNPQYLEPIRQGEQ